MNKRFSLFSNVNSIKQQVYFWLFGQITYLTLSILFLTVFLLILQGGRIIDWQFLTQNWSHSDITKGGIFPAIFGSICLGLGVMVVSFPIGFLVALYLTEYLKISWLRRLIQLIIRNLAGIPSVVYGMFGLVLFVHFFQFGSSLLSAILTLSVMTLPWVITSTIEALEALPRSWREASLALGATRWQTMAFVIIPASIPSSLTGGIVANARAIGETAPIIVVGATFYLSKLPTAVTDKFMALPYHIFILATQHSSQYATSYAAASALVLIMISFGLSFIGMIIRYYLRKNLKG